MSPLQVTPQPSIVFLCQSLLAASLVSEHFYA